MQSPKKNYLEIAKKEKLEAPKTNNIWRFIKRPSSSNTPHTKWVFKTKSTADGDVERLKARLVACGNEQVFGFNYVFTFAAVMDIDSEYNSSLAAAWGVHERSGA